MSERIITEKEKNQLDAINTYMDYFRNAIDSSNAEDIKNYAAELKEMFSEYEEIISESK